MAAHLSSSSVVSLKKKTRILVIDDSAVIRKAATKMLGSNFDVVVADDGEQGWRAIKNDTSIAVVFTDINMPNMDGVELILKVKKRNPDIAIIAMSGAGLVGGALNTWSAGKIGADEVLEKLFDYAEMIDTAKQLIAQS